jgi:hypothetical protein
MPDGMLGYRIRFGTTWVLYGGFESRWLPRVVLPHCCRWLFSVVQYVSSEIFSLQLLPSRRPQRVHAPQGVPGFLQHCSLSREHECCPPTVQLHPHLVGRWVARLGRPMRCPIELVSTTPLPLQEPCEFPSFLICRQTVCWRLLEERRPWILYLCRWRAAVKHQSASPRPHFRQGW